MAAKASKIDQIWPRVRPVTNGDGSISYLVDTRIAGKGKRLFYPTKTEAQTVAEQARIKRRNEGLSAFSLSNSDRVDAENALEILRQHGLTLKSAADFSVRHLSTITTPKLVGDVVDELLLKLRQDGKSGYYLNQCSSLWRRFAADHPDLRATDVDRTIADTWLRGLEGISGDTRNGYASLLSSLFIYAVNHRYAVENPFKAIPKAKSERGIPRILTIPQVISLLRAAEPRFMPSLLLGLFAGLRPWSEVCRLRWDRIDFEDKHIDIAPGCTKNHKSVRWVKMSDNLIHWLLPYRKASGMVIDSVDVYNDLRERMCARAGFGVSGVDRTTGKPIVPEHGEWTQDILRHTFGSMFHVLNGTDDTIKQMGHVGTDMFFRHYRARVTKAEAETFWNLRPVSLEAKLVRPEMVLPELWKEYLAAHGPERLEGDSREVKIRKFSMTRSVCTRFCEAHPRLRVSHVRHEQVEAWLDQLGLGEGSRVQYKAGLSRLFKHAVEHGYTLGNPAINHGTGVLFDVQEPVANNVIPMLAAV